MALEARFDWHVPGRAAHWPRAWNASSATYARRYADPESWPVTLDASASGGGSARVEEYRWDIAGLDGIQFNEQSVDRVADSGALDASGRRQPVFSKRLPALGRYRVSLTVVTLAAEISAPAVKTIQRADLLVVSLGDSMASGEGNPDGAAGALLDPETNLFTADPADWVDRRCHRSARSGHARAARALEWPRRSVTFLSFACSGAKIGTGMRVPYGGIERPGGAADLPSQIDQVLAAIGNRDIDVLMISAGLNDLGGSSGFGSIIESLAGKSVPVLGSEQTMDAVEDRIPGIGGRMDELSWDLSRALQGRIRRVYWTEYPYHVIQPRTVFNVRQGCGALSGILPDEGDFIHEAGQALTAVCKQACRRNRHAFVKGVKSRFEGHGYCAGSSSFYVGVTESQWKQANLDGPIHPNADGHKAIRDALVETITRPYHRPPRHTKRLRVIFDWIEILVPPGTDAHMTHSASVGANDGGVSLGRLTVQRRHLLDEQRHAVAFFVDDGLCGPWVRVRAHASLPRLNPEEPGSKSVSLDLKREYGEDDDYGIGAREESASRSGVTLRIGYRIVDITRELGGGVTLPARPAAASELMVTFTLVAMLVDFFADAVQTAGRVVIEVNEEEIGIGRLPLRRAVSFEPDACRISFVVDTLQERPFFQIGARVPLPRRSPEDPRGGPQTVVLGRRFGAGDDFGQGRRTIRSGGVSMTFRIDLALAPGDAVVTG